MTAFGGNIAERDIGMQGRLRPPLFKATKDLAMTGDEALAKGYKRDACATCAGYGVVGDYHDNDFHGATDCPTCKGSGGFWITPNGRRVLYPGGPFC